MIINSHNWLIQNFNQTHFRAFVQYSEKPVNKPIITTWNDGEILYKVNNKQQETQSV